MSDIATDRRNAIERQQAATEAAGMEQLRQREANAPLVSETVATCRSWQSNHAEKVSVLLATAGIKYPSCPYCGKQIGANIRTVIIPQGGYIPIIGETVQGDYGKPFKYIGTTKFETASWPVKVGEIHAHCPDGTFGRADHFPFCTARCCCRFAQASYRAGFRMKGE